MSKLLKIHVPEIKINREENSNMSGLYMHMQR